MFDVVLPQSIPLAETVIGAIIASNACKGVSKLGTLIFGKQFRLNEYKNTLMKAQAERDAKAIEAEDVRFDGATLQPALALPSLPPNVPLEYLPMLEGQRQESSNLNANLGIAFGILADTDDKDISDESVSPGWFARWRREAQVIGDHELQNIWGRILAEEVKQPKSVSLKTLDVLKNVTAEDAELFCRVARYHVDMVIFDRREITPWPYTLDEILYLENLGFLGGNADIVPELTEVEGSNKKFYSCHGFILIFETPIKKFYSNGMAGPTLSVSGNEILRVADNIPAAQPDVIKTIGDVVWSHLPKSCKEMKAHPTTGDDSFDDNIILQRWNR